MSDHAFAPILDALDSAFSDRGASATAATLPFVTLAYAQSLDGSIAGETGKPLRLSGSESMHMTHLLRAWHDSILVGVGTVVADDPSLTVRLCSGAGSMTCVVRALCRGAIGVTAVQL